MLVPCSLHIRELRLFNHIVLMVLEYYHIYTAADEHALSALGVPQQHGLMGAMVRSKHLRGQIQDEAGNGFNCGVVEGHCGRQRNPQLAAQQAGQLHSDS